MKFVPNPAFERLNSLMGGVEALGCMCTVRLEAFSCRKGKEEKRTAQILAERANGSAPNSSSGSGQQQQPYTGQQDVNAMFPAASFVSDEGEGDDSPSTTDDRFLYLVCALNTLYGGEYDFTILSQSHFQLVDPYAAMAEVDTILNGMPSGLIGSNPHGTVWSVLNEQLVPASGGLVPVAQSGATMMSGGMGVPASPSPSIASECEFFKFVCPECDPTAQAKLWSLHYFIYSRRTRLMVSLLAFGEGNPYRGDDYANVGGWGVANSPTAPGPYSDSPMQYCEPDGPGFAFPSQPHGYGYASTDKNRDFYGYSQYE